MIRFMPKIALLIGALAIAGQANARDYYSYHNHHRSGYNVGGAILSAVIGGVVVSSFVSNSPSRPVYVQQPVYAPPPPPPVYYQPVYVAPPPQPVYYAPPSGYYPSADYYDRRY